MDKLGIPNEASASGNLWEMVRRARVTTFIGAGGKTTCLNGLTQEIAQIGEPVIATTTTKVYPSAFPSLCKNAGEFPFLEKGFPCFWYADIEEESGKWRGIPVEMLERVIQEEGRRFFWVIEGDGARERRLKCWASHEPQIPGATESAVLVIDGHLWGKTLHEDEIHRPELCPQLAGQIWSSESAWEYILSSPVFRREYREISWVVLFNVWKDFASDSPQNILDSQLRQLHQLHQLHQLQHTALRGMAQDSSQRPHHLRIASGDAKEGRLQWFDLW